MSGGRVGIRWRWNASSQGALTTARVQGYHPLRDYAR